MSPLIWIFLLPLLGAVGVLFVPPTRAAWMRRLALVVTGIVALLALDLLDDFDAAPVGAGGYRFVQQIPWIESMGISLHLGVDGINLGLIIMGAIVAFAAVCVSH